MSAPAIMFTGMVCLYSTGHWIGGTVLLIIIAYLVWNHANDPAGIKALAAAFRRSDK